MYIRSQKEFADFYDESLDDYVFPEGLITFDWRDLRPETIENISEALDRLGIDIVEYETNADFYALRFVKRDT